MDVFIDPTGLDEKSNTGLTSESELTQSSQPWKINPSGEVFEGVLQVRTEEVTNGSWVVLGEKEHVFKASENSYPVSESIDESYKEKYNISGVFLQDNLGFVTPIENYEFNNTLEGEGYPASRINKIVVTRLGKPHPIVQVFDNSDLEGEPLYTLTQTITNHWGKECDFALARSIKYHSKEGDEVTLVPSWDGSVYFGDLI